MKLYHTTKKTNLDSILRNGLKPGESGIVYLSERADSWWQGDEYVTLEVDCGNLKGRFSTFNEKDLDEILYWGAIPPCNIRVFG